MLAVHKRQPVDGRRGRKPSAFPLDALAAELRALHPKQSAEVTAIRKQKRAESMAARKVARESGSMLTD